MLRLSRHKFVNLLKYGGQHGLRPDRAALPRSMGETRIAPLFAHGIHRLSKAVGIRK